MNKDQRVMDQEMKEEMVGVLTAISIVSKRLARRLSQIQEHSTTRKRASPRERKVRK